MNGKRYLQTGAVPYFKQGNDIYENWLKTGQNTGNLYIGYSTHQQLDTFNNTYIFGKVLNDEEAASIRESYDILVIAASNFINPYSDFTVLAQNINKLKMPVLTLGIGAQADSTESVKIKLKNGTRELVNAISNYSNTIGVRGEYTAEVLNYLGIKNTEIIGCPTYYVNKNPKYKVNSKVYKNYKDIKVSYNFTNLYNEIDRKIALLALNTNSDVIGQMEYIEDYWRNNKVYKQETLENFEEIVKRDWHKKKILYNSFIQNFEEYKNYLKEHFYMFYNIPDWISKIKEYDYVCGTRFHGCMVAIQNHVPGLLVTHDSRTSELATYCNIPSITKEEFLGIRSFEEVLDRGLIDYDKFNREYEGKFYKYIQFLKSNGIENVNSLFQLNG